MENKENSNQLKFSNVKFGASAPKAEPVAPPVYAEPATPHAYTEPVTPPVYTPPMPAPSYVPDAVADKASLGYAKPQKADCRVIMLLMAFLAFISLFAFPVVGIKGNSSADITGGVYAVDFARFHGAADALEEIADEGILKSGREELNNEVEELGNSYIEEILKSTMSDVDSSMKEGEKAISDAIDKVVTVLDASFYMFWALIAVFAVLIVLAMLNMRLVYTLVSGLLCVGLAAFYFVITSTALDQFITVEYGFWVAFPFLIAGCVMSILKIGKKS